MAQFDVVVVGGGNAGFTAATSAAQAGARVCLVEKAPADEAGGNTYFTEGRLRFCFDGREDLLPLLHHSDGTKGLPSDLAASIDAPPYTADDFYADIRSVERKTQVTADPDLVKVLVENSRDAVRWLTDNGARLTLSFDTEPPPEVVDGRYKFSKGWVTHVLGRGRELFAWHVELARKHGVTVHFGCAATELIRDSSGGVTGVRVERDGEATTITAAGGVILASGGLPSSLALRPQFVGPGWDTTQVRGSTYSTGQGHDMVRTIGGKVHDGDNPNGRYTITQDGSLAPLGGGTSNSSSKKLGYPLGVMLNIDGRRFVDEGQDTRSFTYPVIGRAIAEQPRSLAFQVWDAAGLEALEAGGFDTGPVAKVRAYTLEDLATVLERRGLRNREQFLATIAQFNEACRAHRRENPEVSWDPSRSDGLSTQNSTTKLEIPKSNWALPLERGPFAAVGVACGISFGHGGVTVSAGGEVVGESGPIPGLWCAGEIIGGPFWHGAPRGSGLIMGVVLGREAGGRAARRAQGVR